jgi:RNA polymerase sigma-70 factor (ECF subfamily)
MEAEEILQDCFLKAFNGLNNFKQESKFSTWFYRIVYNTALTRLSSKKRKIEKEMTSIDLHYDLKSSYDFNNQEQKDLSVFLKDLIEQLPANYAAVVNMFYLNEMSCEEISGVTGASISNVKVILYRSRDALRKILSKNKLTEEFK